MSDPTREAAEAVATMTVTILAAIETALQAQYQAGLTAGGGLARFGARILEAFREDGPGDLDGGEVQAWAEAAGLVERRTVTEPCGADWCPCEPGDTCSFLTEATQRALAALRGEPPAPEGA